MFKFGKWVSVPLGLIPNMPEKLQQSYTMTAQTLRKVAESELSETTKGRKRALRELRDWLKNQRVIFDDF